MKRLLLLLLISLALPTGVRADDAQFYFDRAYKKSKEGDNYGAIVDYTKSIKIDSSRALTFFNRAMNKKTVGDMNGACADWKKVALMNEKIFSYMAISFYQTNCEKLNNSEMVNDTKTKLKSLKGNDYKHSKCLKAADYKGCMNYQNR